MSYPKRRVLRPGERRYRVGDVFEYDRRRYRVTKVERLRYSAWTPAGRPYVESEDRTEDAVETFDYEEI